MQFPIVLAFPDGSRRFLTLPVAWRDDAGTEHPPESLLYWTPDDWAVACPNIIARTVIDPDPPEIAGKRAEQKPIAEWEIGLDAATVTYDLIDLTPDEEALQIIAVRHEKVRVINAERDRRLVVGALHGGKRFSMSDASRTDLGGMATTAGLVLSGALPTWPESYAQGWIAIDNTRLPLPGPAEGIALAAAVGVAYSAIVQHARDLKDAAQASGDPATVDELAGWPE